MKDIWIPFALGGLIAFVGTASAAASCFPGNYTEAKIGHNVLYNLAQNGTVLVATALVRGDAAKVNWTNGTGFAHDNETFEMTFYYENGWIDHELAKAGPNCVFIAWNNTANWTRMNRAELKKIRNVFLVDTSSTSCTSVDGIQCSNRSKAQRSNGLPGGEGSIFLRDSHCKRSALPLAFRWKHPSTENDVVVLRETEHRLPMLLHEVHGDHGVVVYITEAEKNSASFMEDVMFRYPSATAEIVSVDEYTSRLMEWSDTLQRVDTDALQGEC